MGRCWPKSRSACHSHLSQPRVPAVDRLTPVSALTAGSPSRSTFRPAQLKGMQRMAMTKPMLYSIIQAALFQFTTNGHGWDPSTSLDHSWTRVERLESLQIHIGSRFALRAGIS